MFLIRTPTASPPSSDAYHAPLLSLFGRAPVPLSLLTTAFPATQLLADLLTAPATQDAMVITSARSVQALGLALSRVEQSGGTIGPGWDAVEWFVVGRPTREGLLALDTPARVQLGWAVSPENVLGEETGSAEVLGPFILAHYRARDKGKRRAIERDDIDCDERAPIDADATRQVKLTLSMGDKNRDTLERILLCPDQDTGGGERARVELAKVRVYETGVADNFGDRFSAALHAVLDEAPTAPRSEPQNRVNDGGRSQSAQRTRLWIVLFSPSGAQAVLPLLRKLNLVGPPTTPGSTPTPHQERSTALQPRTTDRVMHPRLDVRLAAIGPTTRDWLEADGVGCDAMARSPDPEGLAEALREAEARLGGGDQNCI